MSTRKLGAILAVLAIIAVAEIVAVQADGAPVSLVITSSTGHAHWIGPTDDIKPGSYPGTVIVEEEGYFECVCPTPISGCVCRIVDPRPKP